MADADGFANQAPLSGGGWRQLLRDHCWRQWRDACLLS